MGTDNGRHNDDFCHRSSLERGTNSLASFHLYLRTTFPLLSSLYPVTSFRWEIERNWNEVTKCQYYVIGFHLLVSFLEAKFRRVSMKSKLPIAQQRTRFRVLRANQHGNYIGDRACLFFFFKLITTISVYRTKRVWRAFNSGWIQPTFSAVFSFPRDSFHAEGHRSSLYDIYSRDRDPQWISLCRWNGKRNYS